MPKKIQHVVGFNRAKLRAVRHEAGESQDNLAQTLDVGQGTVRKWEYGERTPSPENLRLLADRYALPEEAFLD